MAASQNPGLDPAEIDNFKKELGNKPYLLNEDEPNNDQVMHFYFMGTYEGKPAIYDAVAYTLLLAYDSKVYETAEAEAQQQYPSYVPSSVDDETGEEIEAEGLTPEIEEFIADRMLALEEEDEIQVSESLITDEEFGFGIGLEVALNKPAITPEVIEQFIADYTGGKLVLDETLYSFPGEEDDEDDA
jgi:hypothetical protein